jgi:peptide/nickel transport system substrate-binding protein
VSWRALAIGCALGFGASACHDPPAPRVGVMTVVQEQQSSWIRNFNPLLVAGARWPTRYGVHEPLLIYNPTQGAYAPWLATAFEWSEDATALRFTIREGVLWSDGQPMGPADVAHTFTLLRDFPALDASGIWTFVADVQVEGEDVVRFDLSRPFVPGLSAIAGQPIVPQHVWSKVKDPVTFSNPDPVGTGPFTEVRNFGAQVFELGANPHYWQEGKPEFEALRFPALQSNEQVNLALLQGEVDWAGSFIPAVERIFVGRDPEHNQYWFPLYGNTVFLYTNTATPPYDDPRVRRALSRGIDRQLLTRVAMHDYTKPSHPTGLSDSYADWVDPQATAAGDWVEFDRTQAAAELDALGMKVGPDGKRTLADGSPWTVEIFVVSGWSDWVRAAQVVARDLQALDIDARVKAYDFGAWFDRLTRGDFAVSLGWSQEGATPYEFYKGLMATATVRPLGEASTTNWHRYGSTAVEGVFGDFERAVDPAEQRRLVALLQRAFVDEAPAIPLFPSPSWGECNTSRFTGFPSAKNPYARLSPNAGAEPLLVMTRVATRDPRVASLESR